MSEFLDRLSEPKPSDEDFFGGFPDHAQLFKMIQEVGKGIQINAFVFRMKRLHLAAAQIKTYLLTTP